ncbi:phage integrase family protein [Murinocardiopsis flavida]|uniref:Phage integrase family protein n=1 Tax=Murinocardiopsis flavida TaxID=645275 RepID=A0A2P8CBA5_9ACTN|nr:phage integrase family protein [Murinocardiopsis flavida]
MAHDDLSIRRQVQRGDGALALVDVKTRAGRRTLPLLPWARDALIEQAGRQADGKRSAGDRWHEMGLVFTNRTGGPLQLRDLSRTFERLVEKTKVRPIRLHDLRHSVASLLKRSKVAPRDAMQILGHSRISVTIEIYHPQRRGEPAGRTRPPGRLALR